jgi:hypothetical protein
MKNKLLLVGFLSGILLSLSSCSNNIQSLESSYTKLLQHESNVIKLMQDTENAWEHDYMEVTPSITTLSNYVSLKTNELVGQSCKELLNVGDGVKCVQQSHVIKGSYEQISEDLDEVIKTLKSMTLSDEKEIQIRDVIVEYHRYLNGYFNTAYDFNSSLSIIAGGSASASIILRELSNSVDSLLANS